jgi:tight adherence protein B
MRLLAILVALMCVAAACGLLLRARARHGHEMALQRMDDMLNGQARGAAPAQNAEMALPAFLSHRLVRAGWELDRQQVMLLGAALLGGILLAARFGGVLGAGLAAILLAVTGFAILEYRGNANMRLLSNAMLGFLERMRQLLSVGHSLSVALQRAAENSPPAVSRCLASTIRRITNGGGVADSIERCAADFGLYELHLLATATRTNLRFGGSMTMVLKNIIENIRRRAQVERELRSSTTQIRASAWVLALLPMFVASVVMFTNPSYARWFAVTHSGHKMIAYAIVSQILGGLCMRLIVRSGF